jgi:hypothetical protein
MDRLEGEGVELRHPRFQLDRRWSAHDNDPTQCSIRGDGQSCCPNSSQTERQVRRRMPNQPSCARVRNQRSYRPFPSLIDGAQSRQFDNPDAKSAAGLLPNTPCPIARVDLQQDHRVAGPGSDDCSAVARIQEWRCMDGVEFPACAHAALVSACATLASASSS